MMVTLAFNELNNPAINKIIHCTEIFQNKFIRKYLKARTLDSRVPKSSKEVFQLCLESMYTT